MSVNAKGARSWVNAGTPGSCLRFRVLRFEDWSLIGLIFQPGRPQLRGLRISGLEFEGLGVLEVRI